MSNDVRCNQNSGAVAGRCGVKAGDTLTVEMHQYVYHVEASRHSH